MFYTWDLELEDRADPTHPRYARRDTCPGVRGTDHDEILF